MSMFDDMKATQVSEAEANADLMVGVRATTGDFGIDQLDNADSFGIDQNLSATLADASNVAQAMSATASTVAGAERILTGVDEKGSRLGGVREAAGDAAKQSLTEWIKQRPEAAFRFLRDQTREAWEPVEDASEASEGLDALETGAKTVAEAPGKARQAMRDRQNRKDAKVQKTANLSVRNDLKAAKHDAVVEKIGRKYQAGGAAGGLSVSKANVRALDRLRLRHHARRAEQLHGKAALQRAWVERKTKNAEKRVATAVMSRRGFIVAAGGVVALPLLVMTVPSCAATAVAAVAAGSSSDSMWDELGDVENLVAWYFLEKGLDALHTAAIMGNMYAESSMLPGNIQTIGNVGSEFSNDDVLALGSVSGYGTGLCQWDSGRRVSLVNYADSVDAGWYDVTTQLDFFWDHDEWGTGWSDTTGTYTESAFLASNDLDEAVAIFCYGWERPGVANLSTRQNAAWNYYNAISSGAIGSSGSGEEYDAATAAQQAVVDACYSTSSPGEGYCAKWVSWVMRNAGYGSVSGNACDMYDSWCTSSSRSQLKVGMIIAVSKHTRTSAGKIYGHVGIYIGDDQVMHNVGPIETMDLDDWISYYGTSVTVRWGWANGLDLSAM